MQNLFSRVTAGLMVATFVAVAGAQQTGTPFVGSAGITETVAQIRARQLLEPIYEPTTPLKFVKDEIEVERRHLRNSLRAIEGSSYPPNRGGALAPNQRGFGGRGPLNPQGVGTNFLGINSSESGFLPPDTQGSVSPTQIVMAANGRIKSFTKAGVLGALNVSANTFFGSVRNASTVSDPRVRWDPITQRWFVVAINVTRPNRVLIAVSGGATITDMTSFTFFQFTQDAVGGGASDNGALADYPTLGVDANALYIGTNMFSTTAFLGSSVFVVRKSALLANSLVVTAFRSIATGAVDGPYTPQGVDNWNPTATEGYFIGVGSNSFGTLWMRRISSPGGTPTISANISVTGVLTTGNPQSVVAQGSTRPLDGIDDRLYMASIHRNTLTGQDTLWCAHHFEVNASGVANSTGNRLGSRWYQIQNFTGSPSVVQAGTVFDPAATNPKNYWFPSIAMSGQGHVALGFSSAGAANRTAVATCGRFSSDALGSMQPITTVITATTDYNAQTTGTQRWGDYSQTVVDPVDNMTMWTFQEYCSANNQWGCRAVKLIAPPPATISTVSPSTLNVGTTTAVNVVGTVVSGSGFYQGGAQYAPMTASVSGTGVTVNSITFTDPTHVSISLTVAAGATAGLRDLTITNPDGQSVTQAGAITISSPNPIPVLISIAPTTKQALSPTFTLTVNGSNFVASSIVRLDGTNLTTSFVNAGQLTATVPSAMIATVGSRTITVFTPAPGGGTSGGQTLTVTPIAIQPSSATWILGTTSAGIVADLFSSDDAKMTSRYDFSGPRTNPNATLQASGFSAATSASRIDVAFEASSSEVGAYVRVDLFDFTTGQYVVGTTTHPLATTDGVFAASYLVNVARFVSNAGEVRLRLLTFVGSAAGTRTSQVRFDELDWTLWP